MKKTNFLTGLVCLVLAMSSCANNDIALNQKQATIDSLTNVIKEMGGNEKMAMAAVANPDPLSTTISYDDALAHITAYKNLNLNTLGNVAIPKAIYFDRTQIETLLAQSTDCVGLKLCTSVYNNKLVSVAIGVKNGANPGEYIDLIDQANFKGLNFSKLCPSVCDANSPFYY